MKQWIGNGKRLSTGEIRFLSPFSGSTLSVLVKVEKAYFSYYPWCCLFSLFLPLAICIYILSISVKDSQGSLLTHICFFPVLSFTFCSWKAFNVCWILNLNSWHLVWSYCFKEFLTYMLFTLIISLNSVWLWC